MFALLISLLCLLVSPVYLRDIALETIPPLTLVGGATASVLRWKSDSRCHVE